MKEKTILWIIVGIISIWIVSLTLSSYYFTNNSLETRGGWCMGPMHFGMGGMWIFPVFMLVILLVIVFAVFGRRNFRTRGQDSNRNQQVIRDSETALEILKKRYAKGEITKEELDRMKKDIID